MRRRGIRLDEELKSAEPQAALAQLRFTEVAQDDHRDVLGGRIGAKSLEYLEPVQAGHAQIKIDEVGRFLRGQAETFMAVVPDDDRVAVGNQAQAVHLR